MTSEQWIQVVSGVIGLTILALWTVELAWKGRSSYLLKRRAPGRVPVLQRLCAWYLRRCGCVIYRELTLPAAAAAAMAKGTPGLFSPPAGMAEAFKAGKLSDDWCATDLETGIKIRLLKDWDKVPEGGSNPPERPAGPNGPPKAYGFYTDGPKASTFKAYEDPYRTARAREWKVTGDAEYMKMCAEVDNSPEAQAQLRKIGQALADDVDAKLAAIYGKPLTEQQAARRMTEAFIGSDATTKIAGGIDAPNHRIITVAEGLGFSPHGCLCEGCAKAREIAKS